MSLIGAVLKVTLREKFPDKFPYVDLEELVI